MCLDEGDDDLHVLACVHVGAIAVSLAMMNPDSHSVRKRGSFLRRNLGSIRNQPRRVIGVVSQEHIGESESMSVPPAARVITRKLAVDSV